MRMVYDYDDGDVIFTTSDDMGIDSNGDVHVKMGDNLSMNMNTGEMHITSGWPDDED